MSALPHHLVPLNFDPILIAKGQAFGLVKTSVKYVASIGAPGFNI